MHRRPVTPRSRFAEGSMNDRTSAVPPPHFLGPEQHCRPSASLPNLPKLAPRHAPPPSLPPRSSHGEHRERIQHTQHVRHIPDEPPLRAHAGRGRRRSISVAEKKGLSGLWEGLRVKIWGKRRPLSLDGGALPRMPDGTEPGMDADGPDRRDRPTREEMLASYNELMASGFFRARAIQGTRLPPPGCSGATSPTGDVGQNYMPGLETIYSPRMAPPGTPQTQWEGQDPETPDSRGTKRSADEEPQGAARKLRRTTRSISELHSRLRRARDESRPPLSYLNGSRSAGRRSRHKLGRRDDRPSSADGQPAPVISSPVGGPVRLGPGDFDAMRGDLSEPLSAQDTSPGPIRVPAPIRVPGPSDTRTSETGSARLRRVQGANGLRLHTESIPLDPASVPCSPTTPTTPTGPAAPNYFSAPNTPSANMAAPGAPSANWVSYDADPSAPPERRARSPRKKGPLCVVPDANRGIPSVPAIPAHYKGFRGARENGFGVDCIMEDVVLTT